MININAHIESNPEIMLGKPTIKGTRITVELLLRKMADGYTPDEIIGMYPHIKLTDILAAISYAASVIENEEVIKAA